MITDIFLDPDLLPLVISQDEVDKLAAALPELPDLIKDRLTGDYGLSAYDAAVITDEGNRIVLRGSKPWT